MDLGFAGKTFVVLGGTRGIGRQIAEQIVEEGGRVVVVARNYLALQEFCSDVSRRFGYDRILGVAADCLNHTDLDRLREDIKSLGYQIGGLVMNVGSGQGSVEPIPSSDDWEASWRTNFVSSLLPARELLPVLNETGSSMVFVGSIAGAEVIGAPTEYSTSKAAQMALTKNLAIKLAPLVRVNMVMPGNVLTEEGTWAKKLAANPREISKMINDRVPLQRFGSPIEIANAVCFLLSEVSAFTTGAILRVDGGQSVGIE